MQNSLLITEDRIYQGETNLEGMPFGRGFLIDLNYLACFEGWFSNQGEGPGHLRIINEKGRYGITDKNIDFTKSTFKEKQLKTQFNRVIPQN